MASEDMSVPVGSFSRYPQWVYEEPVTVLVPDSASILEGKSVLVGSISQYSGAMTTQVLPGSEDPCGKEV